MANAKIGNEELVPRIEKAITTLTEMRDVRKGQDEKIRLTNKIEGMELVLNAQRERFQNMRTPQDVVALAAMIAMDVDPKHKQGVDLVRGYLMEYYEA
jgi:hypothetical protein